MKKTVSILLVVCLLLTTGCAGSNSGAVSQKPLEIKKISSEPIAVSYEIKNLDFPQKVWFRQNNGVSIDDKLYLLGSLEENFLFRIDKDGSEPMLLASGDDLSEQWCAICSIGEKLYVLDNANNQIIEFDLNGERLHNIILPEESGFFDLTSGSNTIYALGEGTIDALTIKNDKAEIAYTIKVPNASCIWGNDSGKVFVSWKDGEIQAISTIDEEDKCMGETHYFDTECRIVGYGTQWELYLLSGNVLFGYNFSTKTIQKILTFSDVGLLANGAVYESYGGELIYTGSSGHEASHPLLLVPIEKTEENVNLKLATIGMLHPSITEAVLTWNQSHPECHIEIKDYSVYSTDGDPRSAELQLAADIASGNGPDIYNLSDFDTSLNASLLARRNLLENLYPYIDSDSELFRDDFFSGPLLATEMDGELFQITPYFLLLTTVAAKQDVGVTNNWTYEHLKKVVEDSSYYQYLFDTINNRAEWLELMVAASGNKLVDWSRGQCKFDSDYFINLLEMAAERPVETNSIGGRVSDLIHESQALLFTLTIRTVSNAGIASDAYGEGKYAFVGLPEVGNVLVPELSLGMSTQSVYKEQCWEFLREFLLKDSPYAKAGIPLRRDGARQQLNNELEVMKEYPVEYPGKEQAMEDMISLIEGTTVLYQTDTQLWNIIEDEVNRFYDGQCTAAETAQKIQSRASIYISEQFG